MQGNQYIYEQQRLYGVLPTFRRPSHLADTLKRVSQQTRRLDGLVVVDNSPCLQTKDIVNRYGLGIDQVQYVPSRRNLGFAGGVGLGMDIILRFADDDDWIVVFDDDDPPRDYSVFAQLEKFGEGMLAVDPYTASVGLMGARFNWKRAGLVRISDEELSGPVSVDFIGGNHFPFYLVKALRRVGTFSPDIFFGLSEVEHGLRLRQAGYSIYAHGSLWRERRAGSGRLGLEVRRSKTLTEINWRRYYSLRNLIYILKTNGEIGTAVRVTIVKGLGKPLLNIGTSPRLAIQHLVLNVKACWHGWRGKMGHTIDPDGLARPITD